MCYRTYGFGCGCSGSNRSGACSSCCGCQCSCSAASAYPLSNGYSGGCGYSIGNRTNSYAVIPVVTTSGNNGCGCNCGF